MAENVRAHLEQDSKSFATLSDNSSALGGSSKGNMISLSNNNFDLVSSPTPPSSSNRELCILPCKTKEEKGVTTSSNSKGRKGRPRDSKNKPKPPIIIKEDSNQHVKPIILEIFAGNDIIEAIIKFASRHCAGISVLCCSGSVSNVTLCHPLTDIAPPLYFTGDFNIISLMDTYISGVFTPLSRTLSCSSFFINFSQSQSKVFGGVVEGKVVAAGRVVVVGSIFKKLEHHKVCIINGRLVEEGDLTYGPAINVDASNLSGITNTTAATNPNPNPNDMYVFSVTNSTSLNRQLLSP